MKSAVNISLIPELTNTPHIPPGNFEEICKIISDYGYDAVELFPRSGKDIPVSEIKEITEANNLKVCAFGTGAGKVLYGLTLTSPDKSVRREAVSYISEIIKVASKFNSLVIIGSMQGSVDEKIGRGQTTGWLTECLNELSQIANGFNVNLVFEPINRYESNCINSLGQGIELIKSARSNNIKLLADLFHMNIEERSVEQAIIQTASHIGHIHFADSNRLFPGLGHTDFSKVFKALHQIHYEGYISVEAMVTKVHTDLQRAIEIFNAYSKRNILIK
jgi:sugar phosphate isomerase/epimerase